MSFTVREIATIWRMFDSDRAFSQRFPSVRFTATDAQKVISRYLRFLVAGEQNNKVNAEVLAVYLKRLLAEPNLSLSEKEIITQWRQDLINENVVKRGEQLKLLIENEAKDEGIVDNQLKVNEFISQLKNSDIQAPEEKAAELPVVNRVLTDDRDIADIRLNERKYYEAFQYFLIERLNTRDMHEDREILLGNAAYLAIDDILNDPQGLRAFQENIRKIIPGILRYLVWEFNETNRDLQIQQLSEQEQQSKIVELIESVLNFLEQLKAARIPPEYTLDIIEAIQEKCGMLGKYIVDHASVQEVGRYVLLLKNNCTQETAPRIAALLMTQSADTGWNFGMYLQNMYIAGETVSPLVITYLDLLKDLMQQGAHKQVLDLLEQRTKDGTTFGNFLSSLDDGQIARAKYIELLDSLSQKPEISSADIINLSRLDRLNPLIDASYEAGLINLERKLGVERAAPGYSAVELLGQFGEFKRPESSSPSPVPQAPPSPRPISPLRNRSGDGSGSS